MPGSLTRNVLVTVFLPVLLLCAAGTIIISSTSKHVLYQQKESEILQTVSFIKFLEHSGNEDTRRLIKDFITENESLKDSHLRVQFKDGTILTNSSDFFQSLIRGNNITSKTGIHPSFFIISLADGTEALLYSLPVQDIIGDITGFEIIKSLVAVDGELSNIIVTAALVEIFIVFTIVLLSIRFLNNIRSPLSQLTKTIAKMKQAEFISIQSGGQPTELKHLFDQYNDTIIVLDRLYDELQSQNSQSKAVLASMVEPVILLDNTLHIHELNKAACRLVHREKSQARGKTLLEVFRNSELQEFAQEVVSKKRPLETEITLYRTPPGNTTDKQESNNLGPFLHLQVHGTVINRDYHEIAGGIAESMRVLVVFNDITKLKNLEKILIDFVANVSHELKTPITTIKGFVETLLNGAIQQPEKADHFLNIMLKQTDRLNSIIEDLLSLSRLEQFGENRLDLEPYSISKVVASAAYVCRKSGDKKSIPLNLSIEDQLFATINPLLMEQAVVNLIDNAIKYSEPGSPVSIATYTIDDTNLERKIVIEVEDKGNGISAKHLPRIFERFYRVDKARSRELGGTGLGLAIVKHIIIAHGGEIGVDSVPGKGSSFRIYLPEYQENADSKVFEQDAMIGTATTTGSETRWIDHCEYRESR